eukprot:gnl/TRDRNA2_/TRDRNA2_128254_c0_seq1.p1 gnl/TRDRNA2_/TRDRNA2_128254_c0~~gnl/TRDRNA2_/TRDRNA2_128254_c0_seq1.p1  ORF type:complete len:175 (+),score=20.04 gnl/TRDRNA2_/TRDRNA2_128254_c0_seq1:117-641(+)
MRLRHDDEAPIAGEIAHAEVDKRARSDGVAAETYLTPTRPGSTPLAYELQTIAHGEMSSGTGGASMAEAGEQNGGRSDPAGWHSSVDFASIPRRRLGGACCSCCHRHRCCRGGFPNTHTLNQFFTPLLWANFCRLGRELSAPAVSALEAAQAAPPAPGLRSVRYHEQHRAMPAS